MVESVGDTNKTVWIRGVDLDTVRQSRGWFFVLGLALMILGVLAILLPYISSLVSAIVIGWLMAIAGVVQGVHAIRNRKWGGSGWALAGAAVLVVAGLLVAMFPVTGTLTLTVILAAFFAATGVVKIIRASQHRRMPAWGWLLFDGIVSLALGILIIAGFPSTAAWALGLLVGIDFLLSGSSMLVIGLSAGPIGAGPMTTTRV